MNFNDYRRNVSKLGSREQIDKFYAVIELKKTDYLKSEEDSKSREHQDSQIAFPHLRFSVVGRD